MNDLRKGQIISFVSIRELDEHEFEYRNPKYGVHTDHEAFEQSVKDFIKIGAVTTCQSYRDEVVLIFELDSCSLYRCSSIIPLQLLNDDLVSVYISVPLYNDIVQGYARIYCMGRQSIQKSTQHVQENYV